jgi:hypothetical protein
VVSCSCAVEGGAITPFAGKKWGWNAGGEGWWPRVGLAGTVGKDHHCRMGSHPGTDTFVDHSTFIVATLKNASLGMTPRKMGLCCPTLAKLGWGTHFRAVLRRAGWGLCCPRSPNARDRGHPFSSLVGCAKNNRRSFDSPPPNGKAFGACPLRMTLHWIGNTCLRGSEGSCCPTLRQKKSEGWGTHFRGGTHQRQQQINSRSFDADVGLDGEAGAELVVRVLIGEVGEVDAHRKALDDFDVVAGGVLRREERED